MKNLYLFILLAAFAALPLRAEKVDPAKAGEVARRYMQTRKGLRPEAAVRLSNQPCQQMSQTDGLTYTGLSGFLC
jgi:hypothetical protein